MIWKTTKLATYSVLAVLIFVAVTGLYLYSYVPSRSQIRGCMTTKMFQVHLCPGSTSYVPLSRISQNLQKAVVLTEDSAFWDHGGFDLKEIQRSMEQNMAKGSFARGGSTISQQLAKNLFLTPEKTMQRKVLEALITLQLEKYLTKKEILERYLNVVEFGPNIFGVKQAAQYYFKKDPASLNVVDSAFLAFLLPSPEKYSVSFFKKNLTPFARKRLNDIINSLYRYNRISADEYQVAKANIDYFIQGSPYQAAPTGLDLNAPEEEFWETDSDAEPYQHPMNRNAGKHQGDRNYNKQLQEDERVFENSQPVQDQPATDLDNMGQGQQVEESL